MTTEADRRRTEWGHEPNKVEWVDISTGLVCLAKRNRKTGAWHGYVGIPHDHVWFSNRFISDGDMPVHGGIKYVGMLQRGNWHEPGPGDPGNVWWVGFSCSDVHDRLPYLSTSDLDWWDEVYRNLEFVQNECANIAAIIFKSNNWRKK